MRMPSLAFIAAALTLLIGGVPASPARAQTDTPAATGAVGAPAAVVPSTTPTSKKKKKRSKKSQAAVTPPPATDDLSPPPPVVVPAPPPPVAPTTTTVMIKEAPAPAAPPPSTDYDGPSAGYDDDPPTIAHTAIAKAMKGKPLVFTAHIIDPSGVFQPVLYLRKRGTGDYLPIKLIGSKLVQGDYAVEVDAKLVSVDLEYYIECYDNAGNGPARVGSPESPLTIILEEEKKPVVTIAPVAVHVGAPPAITHNTVSKAFRKQPVEINAKLIGDTGVSKAKVFFRHVGEHDFRELPMGNIGGDDYTATMPASVVTEDLEYYLEAYDQYGNGPGRSGGPNVPYQITVTEKPPDVVIHDNGTKVADTRPQPHLVKIPFSPNPGRWAGFLFMGGFIATTIFAGGELYSANQADAAYQQTYNYDGRIDSGLHQRSLDDTRRAKIFGIAAVASLAVGITLLIIFPEHPDTQIVTGSGGDVVLAHF